MGDSAKFTTRKYILYFILPSAAFICSIYSQRRNYRWRTCEVHLVQSSAGLGFVADTAREYKPIGIIKVPVVGCFLMDLA